MCCSTRASPDSRRTRRTGLTAYPSPPSRVGPSDRATALPHAPKAPWRGASGSGTRPKCPGSEDFAPRPDIPHSTAPRALAHEPQPPPPARRAVPSLSSGASPAARWPRRATSTSRATPQTPPEPPLHRPETHAKSTAPRLYNFPTTHPPVPLSTAVAPTPPPPTRRRHWPPIALRRKAF